LLAHIAVVVIDDTVPIEERGWSRFGASGIGTAHFIGPRAGACYPKLAPRSDFGDPSGSAIRSSEFWLKQHHDIISSLVIIAASLCKRAHG
jgi:hypothetical protein